MRAFLVARRSPGEGWPEGAGPGGLAIEPIDGPAELPDALLALERRFAASDDGAVVLGDDSDLSLAAALVAAKLELPLAAMHIARGPETHNGRLIAQIAEVALGEDPFEIAAWARSADGPGRGPVPPARGRS